MSLFDEGAPPLSPSFLLPPTAPSPYSILLLDKQCVSRTKAYQLLAHRTQADGKVK